MIDAWLDRVFWPRVSRSWRGLTNFEKGLGCWASSVVAVATMVIVLDGFAKIMAGCKNVDGREASNGVSARGGGGRSEAVDGRHQR